MADDPRRWAWPGGIGYSWRSVIGTNFAFSHLYEQLDDLRSRVFPTLILPQYFTVNPEKFIVSRPTVLLLGSLIGR